MGPIGSSVGVFAGIHLLSLFAPTFGEKSRYSTALLYVECQPRSVYALEFRDWIFESRSKGALCTLTS